MGVSLIPSCTNTDYGPEKQRRSGVVVVGWLISVKEGEEWMIEQEKPSEVRVATALKRKHKKYLQIE